MNALRLFDISLPFDPDFVGDAHLYYRSTEGRLVCKAGGPAALVLRCGASVSFDAYFNVFSYAKYREYGNIEAIAVELELKGDAVVSLCRCKSWSGIQNASPQDCVISSQIVHFKQRDTVHFTKAIDEPNTEQGLPRYNKTGPIASAKAIPVYGFYYVNVVAIGEDVEVYGGNYSAQIEEPNPVRLAIGICTYRREEYLLKNLSALQELASENPEIGNMFEVFVADNAGTLDAKGIEATGFHVFPNGNFGGSGGFARTLLEAEASEAPFTHMLFMDDDVRFDPKIIEKTIRLLQIVKPEYQSHFIGGATLHLTNPVFQFEQGSHFDRKPAGRNRFNAALKGNLIENEKVTDANYCGWTYSCFPLSCATENGYPMPFFIRADDAEFALRNKAKMIFMNGIAIWHEPYLLKYSSHLVYYDTRNKMVVRALHSAEPDLAWECDQVRESVERRIVMQLYDEAEFALMAVEDFLEGVDFFLHEREDEHLEHLLNMRMEGFLPVDELAAKGFPPDLKQMKRGYKTRCGSFALYGKAVRRDEIRTVDYDHYDPEGYESSCVIHWSAKRSMGRITHFDARKQRKLSAKLKKTLKRMAKEYAGVVADYRCRYNELTSHSYWVQHLGLDR